VVTYRVVPVEVEPEPTGGKADLLGTPRTVWMGHETTSPCRRLGDDAEAVTHLKALANVTRAGERRSDFEVANKSLSRKPAKRDGPSLMARGQGQSVTRATGERQALPGTTFLHLWRTGW